MQGSTGGQVHPCAGGAAAPALIHKDPAQRRAAQVGIAAGANTNIQPTFVNRSNS